MVNNCLALSVIIIGKWYVPTCSAAPKFLVHVPTLLAYMAWRHYMLWDYRRSALLVLLVAFVCAYAVGISFGILLAKDANG